MMIYDDIICLVIFFRSFSWWPNHVKSSVSNWLKLQLKPIENYEWTIKKGWFCLIKKNLGCYMMLPHGDLWFDQNKMMICGEPCLFDENRLMSSKLHANNVMIILYSHNHLQKKSLRVPGCSCTRFSRTCMCHHKHQYFQLHAGGGNAGNAWGFAWGFAWGPAWVRDPLCRNQNLKGCWPILPHSGYGVLFLRFASIYKVAWWVASLSLYIAHPFEFLNLGGLWAFQVWSLCSEPRHHADLACPTASQTKIIHSLNAQRSTQAPINKGLTGAMVTSWFCQGAAVSSPSRSGMMSSTE